MLSYAVLLVYAIIAGWFFWLGKKNGAPAAQSLLVSLLWPIALLLLLALGLCSAATDVPEDA